MTASFQLERAFFESLRKFTERVERFATVGALVRLWCCGERSEMLSWVAVGAVGACCAKYGSLVAFSDGLGLGSSSCGSVSMPARCRFCIIWSAASALSLVCGVAGMALFSCASCGCFTAVASGRDEVAVDMCSIVCFIWRHGAVSAGLGRSLLLAFGKFCIIEL